VRQLLALKWRLLPLAAAAVVLCIPIANAALNHRRVDQIAQAAESKLRAAPAAQTISGIPRRIVIPSLSIDLPVISQSYSESTKSWPVSNTDANYASSTAPVNNSQAETLIYGHSTRAIFGPLLKLSPQAIAYVYTDNGHLFKYLYTGSQDVTPYKLSIFQDMAKAPAGLKLITCDGPYFQYRRLMSFKLLQAS
jgi:sortase (surface protein transpeptidase)